MQRSPPIIIGFTLFCFCTAGFGAGGCGNGDLVLFLEPITFNIIQINEPESLSNCVDVSVSEVIVWFFQNGAVVRTGTYPCLSSSVRIADLYPGTYQISAAAFPRPGLPGAYTGGCFFLPFLADSNLDADTLPAECINMGIEVTITAEQNAVPFNLTWIR